MHILPHDQDPGIARHVAGEHIGHGGGEFDLGQLLGPVVGQLAEALARKLAQIAADAGVDAGRIGEEGGRHPKLVAARNLLGQMGGGGLDHRARLGVEARRHIGADQPQLLQALREGGDGIAGLPFLLLLARAIAELAAGARTRLMEESVADGLDHHRPAALADHAARLLHGAAHGQELHPVHLDGGDAQHGAAGGEPGFPGLLADMGRDRVEIILQEEDDR